MKTEKATLTLVLDTEHTLALVRASDGEIAVVSVDARRKTPAGTEYHRVWFNVREWNSLATAETVIREDDVVEVTGDLEIPETGEAHHYSQPYFKSTLKYDKGTMRHPTISGYIASAGIIKRARIKPAEELISKVLPNK